jgi:hypothetical protein
MTSLEPSENQNWDTNQARTEPFEEDCLIVHTFLPLPQFFFCINLKLMSVPQRWLKMGRNAYVASSHGISWEEIMRPQLWSHYLVNRGEWPDLMCGMPGVWA